MLVKQAWWCVTLIQCRFLRFTVERNAETHWHEIRPNSRNTTFNDDDWLRMRGPTVFFRSGNDQGVHLWDGKGSKSIRLTSHRIDTQKIPKRISHRIESISFDPKNPEKDQLISLLSSLAASSTTWSSSRASSSGASLASGGRFSGSASAADCAASLPAASAALIIVSWNMKLISQWVHEANESMIPMSQLLQNLQKFHVLKPVNQW